MIRMLNFLFLAVAFSFLIGAGPVSLAVGLLVSYLLLRLVPQLPPPKAICFRGASLRQLFYFLRNVILFIIDFLKDLTISNLVIAWDVWTPGHSYRPTLLEIPVDDLTDLETVLLATRITLTPGTLTSDISADRKVLIIHVLYPAGANHAAMLRHPIDILRKDLA